MLKLSEFQIIEKIRAGDHFECMLKDGSFSLKIEKYSPVICTAVHAGAHFRKSLQHYCALTSEQRYYEEDPHTDELIQSLPITLVAHDSRYAYDLNRPVARCIYRRAWGENVWKKALPAKEKQESIEKHQRFYRVLDALIAAIEKDFGACLIFDVHSYNYQRHNVETPDFNLGTEQIDEDRWGKVLDRLLKSLRKIKVQGEPVVAKANGIFWGRGYMISHVNSRFQNTLVLPFEVKKFYMDELTATVFPQILSELQYSLKQSFSDVGAYFARNFTRHKRAKSMDMLSAGVDLAILEVDKKLYRLARNLETLYYINPTNLLQEKRSFFARGGEYQPQFRYRPLEVDPFQFKEQLYRLPLDGIRDPNVRELYQSVIEGLSAKIDMLSKIDSPEFVYSSLNYYGEPRLIDESNARFLLHAAQFEAKQEKLLTARQLQNQFSQAASNWGMTCKVEVSSKLVAAAMVSNSKRAVYIGRDVCLSQQEADALMHHEVGVHMSTTLNARAQPLKVFSLGLPGNTMTQEGLAILNEFQSGNLSLGRLKTLALRVLAVRQMLDYGDFRNTFQYLRQHHGVDREEAFKLSTRVHRAGGFTKDYLYLKGVTEVFSLSRSEDLTPLYVGKTGIDSLKIISEMIERNIVVAPEFVPQYLKAPAQSSEVLRYLVDSICGTKEKSSVGDTINDGGWRAA